MTDDTIRAVLDRYEQLLADLPSRYVEQRARVAHLRTMIPKMREMLDRAPLLPSDEGTQLLREKVMRWLGFLQGAFWVLGLYTIDEMRAHNKPPEEAFRDRR